MPLAKIRRTPDGRARVELTPRKMALYLLGALAFVAVGITGTLLADTVSERVLLVVCSLFFAGIFLILLRAFLRGGTVEVLVVTPHGLETAGVAIPWKEIERVGPTFLWGQELLGIWTKDPFFSARRGPWYVWPLALLNRAFGFPPVSFSNRAVPIDDLLAEIDRHWTSTSTREDVALVPSNR
jgi:hypothetical protein